MDLHGLPAPAIRSIIQRARRRCIPGTNIYSLVCRSWRDASSDGDDSEQLQLLLDLDNLSGTHLDSCLGWIQLYSSCITGLYISGTLAPCWHVMDQLLEGPGTAYLHLTRLELGGRDSFMDLAPHLQQLASLQHLGAHITFKVGKRKGYFSWACGRRVSEVPDLQQLCPQLVCLHLTVDKLGVPQHVLVDKRLSRLLPVGLQQLHLAARYMVTDAAHLTHLTGLGHLTLEVMAVEHCIELMGMDRLQQLELWEIDMHLLDLPPLASKLVGLWDTCGTIPPRSLTQLTQLTALWLGVPHPPAQQQPDGNPLLSLTSLRHLYITGGSTSRSTWLLQGLSSLSSLRSMVLGGSYQPQVLDLVGQVTQLTSLDVPLCLDGSRLDAKSSWVLQQLTGLLRLQIDQAWLEACSSEWGSLQQLTQLVVVQDEEEDPLLSPHQLLAPLQGRPTRLQHVVYVCEGPERDGLDSYDQPPQEVVPSPQPGVRLTLTGDELGLSRAVVRPRPVSACPHLPGVWELLAPVP